jgi:hypothetical protein
MGPHVQGMKRLRIFDCARTLRRGDWSRVAHDATAETTISTSCKMWRSVLVSSRLARRISMLSFSKVATWELGRAKAMTF